MESQLHQRRRQIETLAGPNPGADKAIQKLVRQFRRKIRVDIHRLFILFHMDGVVERQKIQLTVLNS